MLCKCIGFSHYAVTYQVLQDNIFSFFKLNLLPQIFHRIKGTNPYFDNDEWQPPWQSGMLPCRFIMISSLVQSKNKLLCKFAVFVPDPRVKKCCASISLMRNLLSIQFRTEMLLKITVTMFSVKIWISQVFLNLHPPLTIITPPLFLQPNNKSQMGYNSFTD